MKQKPDIIRMNRLSAIPEPKLNTVERIFRDADGSTWIFFKSTGRFKAYDVQRVRTDTGRASLHKCGLYDSLFETMDSVIEKEMNQ